MPLVGRRERNHPGFTSCFLHTYWMPFVFLLIGQVQMDDKLQVKAYQNYQHSLGLASPVCFHLWGIIKFIVWVKLGWPDPIQTWTRQRTTVPAGPTGCCCCLHCVMWKLGQKVAAQGGKKKKDLSRSTPAGDKQVPTLFECYITSTYEWTSEMVH